MRAKVIRRHNQRGATSPARDRSRCSMRSRMIAATRALL
jgi:hypothetical protein